MFIAGEGSGGFYFKKQLVYPNGQTAVSFKRPDELKDEAALVSGIDGSLDPQVCVSFDPLLQCLLDFRCSLSNVKFGLIKCIVAEFDRDIRDGVLKVFVERQVISPFVSELYGLVEEHGADLDRDIFFRPPESTTRVDAELTGPATVVALEGRKVFCGLKFQERTHCFCVEEGNLRWRAIVQRKARCCQKENS